MAKAKKKRAATKRNYAFGAAARECHTLTDTAKKYGSCVQELVPAITKRMRSASRAEARRAADALTTESIRASTAAGRKRKKR